jgi:hypothetical protein
MGGAPMVSFFGLIVVIVAGGAVFAVAAGFVWWLRSNSRRDDG